MRRHIVVDDEVVAEPDERVGPPGPTAFVVDAVRTAATAALGVGTRLVTGNPRHFPMPDTQVEHWEVGAP